MLFINNIISKKDSFVNAGVIHHCVIFKIKSIIYCTIVSESRLNTFTMS